MKLKALFAGMSIALASTAAQAQVANRILVQIDDRSDTITVNGSLNGVSFASVPLAESFSLPLALPVGTFAAGFTNPFNFYEPGTTTLSDTVVVSANPGSNILTLGVDSDTETGAPLIPLLGGGVNFETGAFQTISSTTLSTGDSLTVQFASDVESVVRGSVPEPATWAMMLVGLGGLGAVMRSTRRKSGAAFAAA